MQYTHTHSHFPVDIMLEKREGGRGRDEWEPERKGDGNCERNGGEIRVEVGEGGEERTRTLHMMSVLNSEKQLVVLPHLVVKVSYHS